MTPPDLQADPLQMFLAAARANATRPAVIEDLRTWTYDEIVELVGRLAYAISSAGVEHPRVVINAPQSAGAYAAMFATLMAGGIYCPLNITHPPARRAQVIAQFEPQVVVTSTALPLDGLGITDGTKIVAFDGSLADRTLADAAPPDRLAYVMFTSGSTGEPKGVMVGSEGLGHYTRWAQRAMTLTPDDRWSQHPNIGFDLSVLDIYGALCSGGALVPITATKARLAPGLVIRDRELTIWNSVPSVMDLMMRAGHITEKQFASLRLVTFCGEPLLKEHLDAIFAARPDLVVHNTYGPTEATVSCTVVRLDRDNYGERCRPVVSLGVGIDGMTVSVDSARQDRDGLSEGAEGEIVISGPQVAFGYWRRPDLTRSAFVFSSDTPPTKRSYRTGDWGQVHRGELYFLARTDRQIKRHGYRIELGDIDAAVRESTNRAACTVYVRGRLATFLEVAQGAIPVNEIMRTLVENLPPYMLPDEIQYIGEFPRTANDKIDVAQLQRIAGDTNA